MCKNLPKPVENSCTKKKLCRFDFPKPESDKTRIKTNIDQRNTSRFYVTRRQKTDSMINAYNPHILKAWKANMDIQLVRNVYGVAMYICTYICKSEPEGLKSAIKKVLEQLPNNCSQRKQIHAIGSTVLSHRQISAQEVAFRMTNLPLVESSVKTVFLNCRKPQNRHKILKSKLERDQLDDDNEDVFETGLADYYCLRPQGELWEKMCITTFISWYLLCNSSRHDNHHQPCFQLQNLGKRIRQRSHPARIRMPKIGLHDDNDEYFYCKLYCYFNLPVQHPKSFYTSKSSYNPLSATRRDQLQSDYSNLEYIVIDEISMVSDDMFHFVHQRLEEIKKTKLHVQFIWKLFCYSFW